MGDSFAVTGIDHVELYVRDWDEAAAWYERVLGLTPDERYAEWWESRRGPFVLSVGDGEGAGGPGSGDDGPGTDEGPATGAGRDGTKLALFERKSATRGGSVSPHRVAFRTDAAGFLGFLDRLERLDLTDRDGEPVAAGDAVDHGLSYSVYFTDPDGNLLELTTEEHATVAAELE